MATAAALKSPAPSPDGIEADEAPIVEVVNMGGLVLEKTAYPDGDCDAKILREPTIAPELIRATRTQQRARGH